MGKNKYFYFLYLLLGDVLAITDSETSNNFT